MHTKVPTVDGRRRMPALEKARPAGIGHKTDRSSSFRIDLWVATVAVRRRSGAKSEADFISTLVWGLFPAQRASGQ